MTAHAGPLERYLVDAVEVNGLQVSAAPNDRDLVKLTSRRSQRALLRQTQPTTKEGWRLYSQSLENGSPIGGSRPQMTCI